MCRNDGKLATLTSFTPPYAVELLLFAPEPSFVLLLFPIGKRTVRTVCRFCRLYGYVLARTIRISARLPTIPRFQVPGKAGSISDENNILALTAICQVLPFANGCHK